MALQGTSGIAQILAQGYFESSFRSSLSSFLQAQSQLTRENFSAGRFRVEQGLRSRLINLGALTDVDALQRARIDVARSSLETTDSTLNELASLAASAVGADASTRASLDASAKTLLANIAGNLSATLRDDSDLLIRTDVAHFVPTQRVVSSVQIDRLNSTLDSAGLPIVFDINNAGSRARIQNVIRPDTATAGVLDGDIEFQINGPKGSATFSFLAGASTQQIVDGINNLSDTTGVEADNPGLGGAGIDLITTEYGSAQTFSVVELVDTTNEVDVGAGSATGTDATGTINVDGGGNQNITLTGRTYNFTNVGGVSGRIELFKDSALLGEGVNVNHVDLTVRNGGKALIDERGNVISRVAFAAFDYGSLGKSEGGLDQIDLINDASGALAIISAAKSDISRSLATASGVADGFLASRIETNADQIGDINSSLDEIRTFAQAIDLFDRVRYESQLNTSLGLLSQLSSLFPLSAFSAL